VANVNGVPFGCHGDLAVMLRCRTSCGNAALKQETVMANSGNYNSGFQTGQKNPNAQVATPQQIKSSVVRQDYNTGLKQGQKK
jgi:hypothetical protein